MILMGLKNINASYTNKAINCNSWALCIRALLFIKALQSKMHGTEKPMDLGTFHFGQLINLYEYQFG